MNVSYLVVSNLSEIFKPYMLCDMIGSDVVVYILHHFAKLLIKEHMSIILLLSSNYSCIKTMSIIVDNNLLYRNPKNVHLLHHNTLTCTILDLKPAFLLLLLESNGCFTFIKKENGYHHYISETIVFHNRLYSVRFRHGNNSNCCASQVLLTEILQYGFAFNNIHMAITETIL